MFAHSLPILLLTTLTIATYHPAKRQDNLSFQDVCGASGVDCQNGYCCYSGQACIASNPPQCRDLLLHDWTIAAIDYSSLINLNELNDLTTLGLTLSTIPRTLTFSTVLPSYSDNTVPPQYTPPTYRPELVPATSTSTGAAAGPTLHRGVYVGGVVGVGMVLL